MANAIYEAEPMRCVATLDDGRQLNALCKEWHQDGKHYEILVERNAFPDDFTKRISSEFSDDNWRVMKALVPMHKVNIELVWQGPLPANPVVDPLAALRGN